MNFTVHYGKFLNVSFPLSLSFEVSIYIYSSLPIRINIQHQSNISGFPFLYICLSMHCPLYQQYHTSQTFSIIDCHFYSISIDSFFVLTLLSLTPSLVILIVWMHRILISSKGHPYPHTFRLHLRSNTFHFITHLQLCTFITDTFIF